MVPFAMIEPNPFKPFRDATYLPSDFPVTLLDCLMSLEKATQLGWYNHATFAVEDYEYWDHPLNGDLHQVMPSMEEVGKFVAFKGPSSNRSLSLYTNVCVLHQLLVPSSSCTHPGRLCKLGSV